VARLALDTLEAAGDPDAPGRAHALNLQGLALWQHGRPDEALEVLMTAERLAREHGCLVPAGLAVVNRALLLIDLGRDEDAGRLLAASLDGPLAANPRALSGIEHAQGRLCLRREDLPAAERHLRAAIATADDADLPAFALTARQDLAACVEAQGRLGEALGLLREAHAAERAIMGEHGEQRLWAIRMQRDLLAARAAEERLAREREALEARVAERTRELSGALEALRDEMAIRETVQERLRHLARHDGLTGLPNRDAMRREVALALARAGPAGGRVAALLVDLDGFKHVNDTMGHGVGDRVLRAAAGRLDEAVPDGAVVGRVGGDEFLVVVPACPGRAAAAELAGRLRAALDPPLEAGDLRFHIRATVGVAISPEDGDDEEALLRAADLAMYAGKAGGRGRWAFHAAGMGDASRRRMALQGALPGAAGRDELEAVFQPRVRLADGRVAAVEALARWHHPALGAVAPGEFIAVCEDTGEIREVGAWMLGRALETAAALAAAGHDDVGVSVNVSPLELATADFPAAVRDALARAGVAPGRLELEVTESAALDPGGLAAATLTETRATGVRVALDDFGSGYSNLAHLARLPVDRVKLDAGLVRDLERRRDARAIAAAVVALAGEIGLGVTAEGVERSGQLDLLRAMGCDEGQGFLFSAAVPAGAVLAAVAHGAA
jgi:diguanylate cyclase (GGDEF)-like protein